MAGTNVVRVGGLRWVEDCANKESVADSDTHSAWEYGTARRKEAKRSVAQQSCAVE